MNTVQRPAQEKLALFADYYVESNNAKESARKVYPNQSEKALEVTGSRMLSAAKELIAERREKLAKKLEISREQLVSSQHEIHETAKRYATEDAKDRAALLGAGVRAGDSVAKLLGFMDEKNVTVINADTVNMLNTKYSLEELDAMLDRMRDGKV